MSAPPANYYKKMPLLDALESILRIRFSNCESAVLPGRGNEYNEYYLGLNYFIYGHKLKVQTGLQYVDMNDRPNDGGAWHGVSWTTGLRVSW